MTYSKKFECINMIKILKTTNDSFNAVFVDPQNYSNLRLSDDREFKTWDFELKNNVYKLVL